MKNNAGARCTKEVDKGGLIQNALAQRPWALAVWVRRVPLAGGGQTGWAHGSKGSWDPGPPGTKPASGPTQVKRRVACRMPFPSAGPFCGGIFFFAMEGEAGGRHFQAVFSRISQLRLTAGSHWAPDQRQSPARVGVGGSGGREPNNDEDEEEEG